MSMRYAKNKKAVNRIVDEKYYKPRRDSIDSLKNRMELAIKNADLSIVSGRW